MITLTLSEDGLSAGTDGATECHTAERVDPSRMYGSRSASIVRLTLTREQAIEVLDDVRRQIDYRVDERYDCGGTCTEKCEYEPCVRRV